MTEFKINVFFTTGAASLLSFRCTQCPNSLTGFHSLLQVNYISGLI